ncbi:TorF family putative porin [Halomonadaceae bacterium KBTZ08]
MQTPNFRLATCLTASLLGAGALAGATQASAAEPSVTAGFSASNIYLWRGTDLGAGDAQVTGSLDVASGMGAYAGVWASSGDSGAGQEYDLYAGYGTDLTEDISVDASVVNYIYPEQDRSISQTGFADFSEAIVSVNAYDVGLSYFHDITSADYQYMTASYSYNAFSATLGRHSFDEDSPSPTYGEDMTHLDISFQFNDELSFTASTLLDADNSDGTRRTTLLKATYAKSFSL